MQKTQTRSDQMMQIALCADDFAQHQGVDQAVCHLLSQQRLSAVSCMSTAPRWRQQSAPMLRERQAQADYGLHFNLTENFSTGPACSLNQILFSAYSGRLKAPELRQQIESQLDAFEQALQRAPDFIDGHQHVHQLPVVRETLLKILQQRYPTHKPWIRTTRPANWRWLGKATILDVLGGNTLNRQLVKNNFPSNNGFAGVYGFDTPDYAGKFAEWLRSARQGMLLMCHPATMTDANDPISSQRLVEFEFFASDAFTRLLAENKLELARLSQI